MSKQGFCQDVHQHIIYNNKMLGKTLNVQTQGNKVIKVIFTKSE